MTKKIPKKAANSRPSPATKTDRREMIDVAVADLIPFAANSRTHSDGQVAQIAAAIREFGWTSPLLIQPDRTIIAGHGRLLAARKLGLDFVPCIVLDRLTPAQVRALVIADNKLALNAGWDDALLANELQGIIADAVVDMQSIGFSEDELSSMFAVEDSMDEGDPDEVPAEAAGEPVSQRGEVYELGSHRLMCGDSTSAEDWHALMGGEQAALIHADPPYGMGKEKDGVENDNLYAEKLDEFQMAWWRAVRPFVTDNASAYLWGNAPDLWRLWYSGGLRASEKILLRNEIVWDKKNIPGMASDLMTQYPEATERCLFMQIGEQFIGNINAADFPEEWEPIRDYLESEAKAAAITQADIKTICGCGMYGHWFTRSQFHLIPEKHYVKLAKAYPGRFAKPWSDLKQQWDDTKGAGRDFINESLGRMRSYFDNAHESMHDVWDFKRVIGEERHGHATPKPVAMMERCIISSLPVGGMVIEPFGGSGTTLIAAAKTGRVCRTMEIAPSYCDVIRRRWTKFAKENNRPAGTGALE